MKRIVKKLSFNRQTIRNLVNLELAPAVGGMIDDTISDVCPPGSDGCTTTGPATGGNICLKTEFSCQR